LYSHRSSHFLDRPRNEVIELLKSAELPIQVQKEILFDYDKGTLGEAIPLLYKPVVEDSKIGLVRREFEDLDIREQLRVVHDNIEGFEGLIDTIGMTEAELYSQLQKPRTSGVVYDDMVDILSSDNIKRAKGKNGSSRYSVLTQGPGQVGSPGRNNGKAFGIKGKNSDALGNSAQFLTEPPIDRLTGRPLSYPTQGHVLDAKNNSDFARDWFIMRGQQALPNLVDGADAKGLKHMTRKELLTKGRSKEIGRLKSLINKNLEQLSDSETERYLNFASAKESAKQYQENKIASGTRLDSPGDSKERALYIDSGGGDVSIGEGVLRSNGNGKHKNGNGH